MVADLGDGLEPARVVDREEFGQVGWFDIEARGVERVGGGEVVDRGFWAVAVPLRRSKARLRTRPSLPCPAKGSDRLRRGETSCRRKFWELADLGFVIKQDSYC